MNFCEFWVGEDLVRNYELDMSITTNEHHDLDESDFCSHESCEEDVEPTTLEFNDDILSI